MNIWFAADIPNSESGGIACSMRELSAGLEQLGHSTTVITRETLTCDNYLTFALKLGIRLLFKGFNRPGWIIARSTDAVFCAFFIKLLNLKTQIIVHSHGWEEIVYDIERILPPGVVSNPTTWKARFFRFPLLRLMLRLCTYCISGTEYENRIIGERYPRIKNKLVYLPNGVKTQTGIYWKQETYPLRIISVGNATWKKNLIHTVRIFIHIKKKCPDAELVCVGTGLDDKSFIKYCGKKVEGITNISVVNYDTMKDVYSSCPFMIVSSRYEGGHSFAILEAMSYGIVIFASAIRSNMEIVNNNFNGYLITGVNIEVDTEHIIAKLTADPASDTIRQGAVKTAQFYSWNKQVKKLENMLCQTL
jgi:glycosyltransferase involved in cell wall biosynthesis